tara:strand:- start:3597 stop:4109 length:513 start_codon:yes stop_codon:yes gene_type:complete
MSDLMKFRAASGLSSGFVREQAAVPTTQLDEPQKPNEPPKPNASADCSGFQMEIGRLKSQIRDLNSTISTLQSQPSPSLPSARLTIPSGNSYIGYSGTNGLSFPQAFSLAYVSGGGGKTQALNNLFVKDIQGYFFWGEYNFNQLSSLQNGQGFFVRNFGSPIVLDWSLTI